MVVSLDRGIQDSKQTEYLRVRLSADSVNVLPYQRSNMWICCQRSNMVGTTAYVRTDGDGGLVQYDIMHVTTTLYVCT